MENNFNRTPTHVHNQPEDSSEHSKDKENKDNNVNIPSVLPTYDIRAQLYQNISTTQPPLTLQAVMEYFHNHPPSPGHFFPKSQQILSRSLSLTKSMLEIRDSHIVPGQLGLFTTKNIPARSQKRFIGIYTGWLQENCTEIEFDTDPPGRYSLNLGQGSRICAYDKHCADRGRIFPLSYINEYIWDPRKNSAIFDNHGLVHIKAGPLIRKGTELTIGLGLTAFEWKGYHDILQRRMVQSILTLIRRQGKPQWIPFLQTQLSSYDDNIWTPYKETIRDMVLYYGQHNTRIALTLQPQESLGQYMQKIIKVKEFAIHHVFRKADQPGRPLPPQYYENISLVYMESDKEYTRPGHLRQLQRHVYEEQDDPDIVPELLTQIPLYMERELNVVPSTNLLDQIRNTVPMYDSTKEEDEEYVCLWPKLLVLGEKRLSDSARNVSPGLSGLGEENDLSGNSESGSMQ